MVARRRRLLDYLRTRSPQRYKALVASLGIRDAARERDSKDQKITVKALEAHALDTFGSKEKAQHWMNRPNAMFQGKSPRDFVQVDPGLVEAELVRIDHGVYT